jgi:hypothetical protein
MICRPLHRAVLGGEGIYSVHGSPRRSDPKGMHGLLTKEI